MGAANWRYMKACKFGTSGVQSVCSWGSAAGVCFLEGDIFVCIGRVLLRILWGCSSSASLLPSPWDEHGSCFAPGCAMLLVCSSPGQMYSCLSRFSSPGDDFVSKSLFCLFLTLETQRRVCQRFPCCLLSCWY